MPMMSPTGPRPAVIVPTYTPTTTARMSWTWSPYRASNVSIASSRSCSRASTSPKYSSSRSDRPLMRSPLRCRPARVSAAAAMNASSLSSPSSRCAIAASSAHRTHARHRHVVGALRDVRHGLHRVHLPLQQVLQLRVRDLRVLAGLARHGLQCRAQVFAQLLHPSRRLLRECLLDTLQRLAQRLLHAVAQHLGARGDL